MAYTYLLKSVKHNWHYIGSTNDIRKKFSDHNSGKVKSTKFYKPFKLIYYETYETYSLARKREMELKNNSQQKEVLFKRLEIT